MKPRAHRPLILAALAAVVVAAAILAAALSPAAADSTALKERAHTEFEKANYPKAIEFLKQALAENPNDPEIYYYLGYYTHYLCYDSVPLTGFGRETSDEILGYLERAVELDPHYGNAFYFIGAEYGARASAKIRQGDFEGAIEEFRKGREAGGYPDWMIEWGRNLLRSCDSNAILFVGGDAEVNPALYLQCVDGYRTDVTVIPWALLDRPASVSAMKAGAVGAPAPISWSDEQIEIMRPYKWQARMIEIPIPESIRQDQGIEDTALRWELQPDMGRGGSMDRLSAGRALFADILITNAWRRPVYFSVGGHPKSWEGLEPYIQLCGLAHRLRPVRPTSNVDVDAAKALLMDEATYESLPSIRTNDMPRVSGMMQNYRGGLLNVVFYHIQRDEIESAREVFAAMERLIPEDVLPASEQIAPVIESVRKRLAQTE